MLKKYLFISLSLITVLSISYYLLNIRNQKVNEPEIRGVISEDIVYFENYKGFLARPETEGAYPGIIMIHEWWGLNQNIKNQAQELAKEGYIVLAVDLFGTVTDKPEEARKQTMSLNQEKALLNMQSGIETLKSKGATKIGSLGWCFGGAQSLQLSATNSLDATVIYYGNLIEDRQKLQNIKSPILGIFGDQDAQIPVAKVDLFKNNLNELGINNQINVYPGVGHAFANPSNPNFAKNETEDAWDRTLEFLKINLQN